MKLSAYLFFALLLLSVRIFAADIASGVQNSGPGHVMPNGNSGYVELGLAAGYFDSPLKYAPQKNDEFLISPIVSGEYHHGKLFFEASQASQDGVSLGYTAFENNNISVDILAASINNAINEQDKPNNDGSVQSRRERKLLSRESIYSGSGVRITSHLSNVILQYRLVTDTFAAHGYTSTLRVGRGWQVRNWNFHAILSAQYTSAKTNDYWYGIDADETTINFPEYQANSSLTYTGLIGFAYPIDEHWVFRSFAAFAQLPNEVTDSPLIASDDVSIIFSTINYVF
ncbi:MAG: outer membrane protein [Flavobacteriales bacterium]|jgi:outer membrane protein